MKPTDKDKPIRAIPKGVWEGGIANEEEKRSKRRHLNDITTDIQGNGYPVSHENRDD